MPEPGAPPPPRGTRRTVPGPMPPAFGPMSPRGPRPTCRTLPRLPRTTGTAAMTTTDALGLPLTGASAEAARLYDESVRQLQCYTGDPVAPLTRALEDSPGFVAGHVLLGWLCLTGTDADSLAAARTA